MKLIIHEYNREWFTWSMMPQLRERGGAEAGSSGPSLKLRLNFCSGGPGGSSWEVRPSPGTITSLSGPVPAPPRQAVTSPGS